MYRYCTNTVDVQVATSLYERHIQGYTGTVVRSVTFSFVRLEKFVLNLLKEDLLLFLFWFSPRREGAG
jgi:hypothetical protein